MGAGSYPFQKLFSRSHFAPKLGMPFVAELQQGKLSSAVLSFSTVEVCSSDLTHMHVIVTKKKQNKTFAGRLVGWSLECPARPRKKRPGLGPLLSQMTFQIQRQNRGQHMEY